jgi:Rad3-related DNA helicase
MQINIRDRTAKLSIGEFSEFRIGPSENNKIRSNRKRLEEGQIWHNELHKKAQTNKTATDFEVPLKLDLPLSKWTLTFVGRMDQIVLENNNLRIIEIKTVNRQLPCEPEILKSSYKSYFLQLSAYGCLSSHSPIYSEKEISGDLLFVEVDTGITQQIHLSFSEMDMLFKQQISILNSFLQSRMLARKHFHDCSVELPYQEFREGQTETIQALQQASTTTVICFEAATGFGKTGIVLFHALKQLQNGIYDRIVYLTGKSTGQLQVVKQLNGLIPEMSCLNVFQLRSKAEHGSSGLQNSDEISVEELWQKSGLSPQELFLNGKADIDSIIELGTRIGIDPYEISRMLISYSDVLVCDYNYVFHPHVSSVLENSIGFSRDKTLIIIDEAHNLPSRVAGCFDHLFQASVLFDIEMELQLSQASQKLIHACHDLANWLNSLPVADTMSSDTYYLLKDKIIVLKEALQEDHHELTLFSDSAKEILWEYTDALEALNDSTLNLHLWSPQEKQLKINCLDAGSRISQNIQSFAQTVLMSATLNPLENFLDACQIQSTNTCYIKGDSNWREKAYTVVYDARVDTRYKTRTSYFQKTARTALSLKAATLNPIIVFFPSYAYAENILKVTQIIEPSIRIALQPRNLSLGEQEAFVRNSLLSSDLLFLVLGSSFSEGIDLLGGSVDTCMIVGPALPEVNPVQKAKMERVGSSKQSEAFKTVYQIPAITKINQALGRLVRSPKHHANVLLHCKRFSDPSYRDLLDSVYQQGKIIRTENDLNNWIYSL